MISLIEISQRIIPQNDEGRKIKWRPTTVEDYIVPEFHIYESTAKGAKTLLRKKMSKVLAFVNSVRNKRANQGCTIMPISVTSRANLMIWGSSKNITNAISFMKEIGLIETESDYYRFRAYSKYENSSKLYRYYKENEDKLRQYCAERDIEPYWVENTVYTEEEVLNRDRSIDASKVRFSSKVKLVKPDGLSKAEFEKQLTLCLYENYPGLRFHIMKANEINEKCYKDYPEFRIRFQPHFSWSDDRHVESIGIRATNSMINIKKKDRPKVLQEYGFHLEKDINASVPRMTLSLNSGCWVEESEDIYELIYRSMEPEGEFNNEDRESIKKLHMRAYFDSSDKSLAHHTWLAMSDKEGIERQEVYDKIVEFRQAIVEAEGGKLYGSEIFYVESCIYIMTLYDLITSGHMVWLIYDAFYSNGEEDQELFESMILNGVKTNFYWFYHNYWKDREGEISRDMCNK